MKSSFINKVRDTIHSHVMVTAGDRILAGLSGGPDSVALVRVLLAMTDELGFSLGTAHLNHNLRGEEALRDEAFVREFAHIHGLELTVENRDIKAFARKKKLSLEEAGRIARYDFFSRTAKAGGYSRITTGHNWDDHVELVLMNLMRGSGPRGLRGIAPVRENRFIRPLIQMPKAEILAFLDAENQPFVQDSSNSDPRFLRNRVRHRLIPFLEQEFNPDIRTGLDRLSKILTQEEDYMESQAQKAFESVLIQGTPLRVDMACQALAGLHPALAGRVLRIGLLRVKQDLRRITHTHIQDILDLVRHPGNTDKSLDLPGQIRVYKKQDWLCVQKERLPLRQLGRREKACRRESRENKVRKT